MTVNFWNHVARSPRHPVGTAATLRVQIRRSAPDCEFEVELHDVSRQGIRLQTDQRLTIGEPVVITCYDPTDGFTLELPATARWQKEGKPQGEANGQKPRDESITVVGCELNETMGWESIGELFLRGALQLEQSNENL